MKTNKKQLTKIIFIVFFLLVFVGHWTMNYIDKYRIKQEYTFTIGHIIDYRSPSGVSNISSVTYAYYIDGIEFRCTISGFEKELIKFEKEDYRSRNKYWVAYNKYKPQKSMINLNYPIVDTNNIPNNLSEFEFSGTYSKKISLPHFKK